MTPKKGSRCVWKIFACELLKLVSGSKTGYAPWNAEKGLNVTSGCIGRLHTNGSRCIWNTICMRHCFQAANQGALSGMQKTTSVSLLASLCICTWENEHSGFCFQHIFFLLYELNLNNQDFVYLEFVKYQLRIRTNMPVSRSAMYACLYLLKCYFICRHV